MKKLFRTYWPLVLMLGGLFVPQVAFAAEAASSGQVMQNTVQSAITLVNTGIGILQFLIWPLLAIAGDLLTNDFIFGAGMEDNLLSLWQQMRNIVNLLFVVVLLVIAFANILGLGQENKYAIKKMMPRFVISLLLVNFSFFAIKVLVDVSNVMTTALIGISCTQVNAINTWPSLPNDNVEGTEYYVTLSDGTTGTYTLDDLQSGTITGFDITRAEFEIKMCGALVDKGMSDDPVLTANKKIYCATTTESGVEKFTGYMNQSLVQGLLKEWSIKNATLLMAVNLMNINQVNVLEVSTSDAPTGDDTGENLTWLMNTLLDLLMKTGVSLVLLAVFGTAVIALIAVLFVRVIVIWNILVLSPLIALKAFIPEGVTGSFDIQKTVIKHITAPVIIAASMGIGFVMLNGLRLSYGTDTSTTMSGSAALTDVKDLAIIAGAVLVIWKGVEEASKDTFAQTIVKSAQDTVKSVGSFAGKAVTYYAPVIPAGTKGEQPLSLAAAIGGLKGVEGQVTSAIGRQQSQISAGIASPMIRGLGLEPSALMGAIQDLRSLLATTPKPTVDQAKGTMQKLVGESAHGQLDGREDIKELLTKMFKDNEHLAALGFGPEHIKLLEEGKVEELLTRLPEKAKKELFDNKSIEQLRAEYQKDGSTAGSATTTTTSATPVPPTTTAITAATGVLSTAGKPVKDVKEAFAAEAKKAPDDKRAQALLDLKDEEITALQEMSRESQQRILEAVVKADGTVDHPTLKAVTDAITSKGTNTTALVQAVKDKRIKAEDAKSAIQLIDPTQLTAAEKQTISTAIDGADDKPAATPPPGQQQPPQGGPPPVAQPPAPPVPAP